jgi:hypothetical protein
MLSIAMFFGVIYLLLPSIISGIFWDTVLVFPVCPLLFILSYYFERRNLTKKYMRAVPDELHLVEPKHLRLLLYGNGVPLILLWLLAIISVPVLQFQEPFMPIPVLIVLGILGGANNFEILGESTARFLFIRDKIEQS